MNKYLSVVLASVMICVSAGMSATYMVQNGILPAGECAQDFCGSISAALASASAGDTVLIAPGTYQETIVPVRSGRLGAPIVVMSDPQGPKPVITAAGGENPQPALECRMAHIVFENLILDGNYNDRDVVVIRDGADSTVIRNCEIRNGTRDGVDISDADWLLIENCEIHHMLNGSYSDQKDAHGVTGGAMRYLTIRGCNIHHVSGDCYQSDPDRKLNPIWDHILIEDCDMWTGPLTEDAARWKKYEIPGENVVDTKVRKPGSSGMPVDAEVEDSIPRPHLVLRNVRAWGYTRGYIGNRAVFNLKEKVEVELDRVVVHDSEVAFRLRGSLGGAHVKVTNSLIYNCEYAIRAEHGVKNVRFYNCTFGEGNANVMVRSPEKTGLGAGFEMKNCLIAGDIPPEARSEKSNLSANSDWFTNAKLHDYRLVEGSPASGAGVPLAGTEHDLFGKRRNVSRPAIGAIE